MGNRKLLKITSGVYEAEYRRYEQHQIGYVFSGTSGESVSEVIYFVTNDYQSFRPLCSADKPGHAEDVITYLSDKPINQEDYNKLVKELIIGTPTRINLRGDKHTTGQRLILEVK